MPCLWMWLLQVPAHLDYFSDSRNMGLGLKKTFSPELLLLLTAPREETMAAI